MRRFPLLLPLGCLTTLALLAVPESLLAHCGCCGRGPAREAPLAARLGLTVPQAREIIPAFERAMTLRVEHYLAMAELTPQMLEAYGAFLEEDVRGEGFSDEVWRETARIHHQEVKLNDQFGRDVAELEQQVEAVLTEPQLQRLQPAGPASHEDHRAALVRHVTGGNMTALGAAFNPEIARTTSDLRKIGRHRHPRPEAIGQQMLHPDFAEQLYFAAGIRPSRDVVDAIRAAKQGTPKLPRARYDAMHKELGQLRGEINAWNLVNGLHLDRDQATTIAACARDAAVVRQAFARGPRGVGARQKLAAQHATAPAVVRQLHQIEGKVIRTLSDTQAQVVYDFKPCLLPPKNLTDPVRVGQARDTSVIAAFLEGVRPLSPAERADAVDKLLAREENHFGLAGKYDADYRDHRRKLLIRTLEQAAQMSDAEFQANLNELAERAQPMDVSTELRYELQGLLSSEQIPGRIAVTMLFDPHMVRALNVRAAQLARPIKTVRRNPAQGPQADNCDDHKCALPDRKNGQRVK